MMNTSRVYFQNGLWHVDFIDGNYELIPAVGLFVKERDAREAAISWNEETYVESLGESPRRESGSN